jgi:hypothetical protein
VQAPFSSNNATVDSRLDSEQRELQTFLEGRSFALGLNQLFPSHSFAVERDPRTGSPFVVIRFRAPGERVAICPADAVLGLLESLPGRTLQTGWN